MKNLKALAAGAVLVSGSLLSGPVLAELSGNIGVASQYVFRGLVFGDPQVSGGVDWADGSGLYAGTWLSSAAGEQEADYYFGWASDMVDIGYIYYAFPQSTVTRTADAQEIYAGINIENFSAMVWYGFNGFSGTEDDEYIYVEANASVPMTEKIDLGIHVGLTENTGQAYDNDPETSFIDYALTLNFGDLFLMVSGIDYDSLGTGQTADDLVTTVGYSWSFEGL